MITNYDSIRTRIENISETIEFMRSISVPENQIQEYTKRATDNLKRKTREFYRHLDEYRPDPISAPIRNTSNVWRTVADRYQDGTVCGDSCTDFIIIPDNGQTDSELEDYVQIHCPYYYRPCHDFPTGHMITTGLSFTRTPAGIFIRHSRGIDW